MSSSTPETVPNLPPNHDARLRLARATLEGLSVADGFGGFFELQSSGDRPWHIRKRQLPPTPWRYTDDTNMALSIYQTLRRHGRIDQDALAASFVEYFDDSRGYGSGARRLLHRLADGADWRTESKTLFEGGSYGNGGAMRVPPLGAYFADDDMSRLVEQARLSAEVTHAHPEGIAGAVAVAVATAVAIHLSRSGEDIDRADFIDRILPHIPESEVREGCIRARDLSPKTHTVQAAQSLGNGSRVTAMDTVPFVLWCAGEYMDDFETAIWHTATGGGDVDTTCAMVGGIVASYSGIVGIPKHWLRSREPLPEWPFNEGDID
jgi:ADP-ribosylglycohydrolase